jgi:hypothetical protein
MLSLLLAIVRLIYSDAFRPVDESRSFPSSCSYSHVCILLLFLLLSHSRSHLHLLSCYTYCVQPVPLFNNGATTARRVVFNEDLVSSLSVGGPSTCRGGIVLGAHLTQVTRHFAHCHMEFIMIV